MSNFKKTTMNPTEDAISDASEVSTSTFTETVAPIVSIAEDSTSTVTDAVVPPDCIVEVTTSSSTKDAGKKAGKKPGRMKVKDFQSILQLFITYSRLVGAVAAKVLLDLSSEDFKKITAYCAINELDFKRVPSQRKYCLVGTIAEEVSKDPKFPKFDMDSLVEILDGPVPDTLIISRVESLEAILVFDPPSGGGANESLEERDNSPNPELEQLKEN
jgi:hypothetical protein